MICQVVGICIFVAAFFLLAVGVTSTSSNIIYGWECAKIAIQATPALFEKPDPDMPLYVNPLLAMSGWINPLVLLYVSFCFAPKFFRVRRILAVAILVCMVATWILFILMTLYPLIGHFLWIGGALLILAPEVLACQRKLHKESE